MPMGVGVWLNPRTMDWVKVSRHEISLHDEETARELGLPEKVIEDIQKLNPYQDVNEIRILGVKHGLVRMRDNGQEVVAQFHARKGRVRNIIWAIYMALDEVPAYQDERIIRIHNLQYDEGNTLYRRELKKKLQNDENILIHEQTKVPESIVDIPSDIDTIKKRISEKLQDE